MSKPEEDMSKLNKEIEDLKIKIAAAEAGEKSEPYLINLGQQLTELRREKNLLLDQSFKASTSGILFLVSNC